MNIQINVPITRSSINNQTTMAPQITEVAKLKEEDIPIDMDYIEIMRPSAKLVREYFSKIANELNSTIW